MFKLRTEQVTSDFDGDGYSDILWQNTSGEVVIWEMNGTSVIGGGLVYIWEMNGTNVVGGGSLGNPGPSGHVIGTGDYYGNGYSDIAFQNTSGEVCIWEMNGTTVIGGGSLGNPGPSWHPIGK